MTVVLRCRGRGLQEEVPSGRQEQHVQGPYSAERVDQAGEKKQYRNGENTQAPKNDRNPIHAGLRGWRGETYWLP